VLPRALGDFQIINKHEGLPIYLHVLDVALYILSCMEYGLH